LSNRVTLDQLQLFVCVVEEGSFSAAGRKLGRAQSAVGYGIANLERGLGVALFDRAGNERQLTETGRALLPEVRSVFEHLARLHARANRWSDGVEPRVTMAIEAMIPGGLAVELCQAFQGAFPHVSLHLRTEGLGGVSSVVLERECMLGISGDYDVGKGPLRSQVLASLRVVPVAAARHPLAGQRQPISRAALNHHMQVTISHERYGSGAAAGLLSEQRLGVVDAATKVAVIEAGLGWGIVPLATIAPRLASGALVALHLEDRPPGPLAVPVFALTRDDVQLGPAAQWLLAELRAIVTRSTLFEPA
jgi:DNA-binding transcriptional LysR family regulator